MQPGKRPISSQSPSIVLNSNNDVAMVTAAAGGETMITHLAQVRGFLLLPTAREGIIFRGIRQSFCSPGSPSSPPPSGQRPPSIQRSPEMTSSGHCSSRYASYWNALFCCKISQISQFPRISQTGGRGANSWVWGKNLLFGKIFVKHCIKMKEIGPRGGARP